MVGIFNNTEAAFRCSVECSTKSLTKVTTEHLHYQFDWFVPRFASFKS